MNVANQGREPYEQKTAGDFPYQRELPASTGTSRCPIASLTRIGSIILSRIVIIFAGLIAAVIVCEIVLRFYNPFSWRLKGDKIILPTDVVQVMHNDKHIPHLDDVIMHSRNSLGFRGPNPPLDLSSYLSIITVGGSTTECYYLSDNRTWPALLGQQLSSRFDKVWLNNAGLDGHTTYGHLVLLRDYLFRVKPKIALFLFGINDIGLKTQSDYDRGLPSLSDSWKTLEMASAQTPIDFQNLSRKAYDYFFSFEVPSTILNLMRVYKSKSQNVIHGALDLRGIGHVDTTDDEIQEIVDQHRQEYIPAFKERVVSLVSLTRSNGIQPVLITQPLLLGLGKDPLTNVNLETAHYGKWNGKTWWRVLEAYNDVTRQIGRDMSVDVIDLAHLLPKNSEIFYDIMHFNNIGAGRVADILAQELTPILHKNYASFEIQ